MRALALAIAVVLVGCADQVQTGLTGVELDVTYPTNRNIDQLKAWGVVDGATAISPTALPDPPRALTSGRDSVVILVDSRLAGTDILVRVDGLAGANVVASGVAHVTVSNAKVVPVTVALDAAAQCGDGVIAEGLEECDDGDHDSGDGCAALCFIEAGYTCNSTPSSCTNGIACNDAADNDADGAIDGADPGCADAADTSELGTNACDDGIDNDKDGTLDFRSTGGDDGCDSLVGTSELNGAPCNNGIDDDGDGVSDFQTGALGDPGCTSVMDLSERGAAGCDDGADNDGDGMSDYPADPGCTGAADDDEHGTLACDDGMDNDSDGRVDFSSGAAGDPGCSSANDNSERGTIACDDSVDNDNDGLSDFSLMAGVGDPGCGGPDDTNERGSLACDDGLDNDGDGVSDHSILAGGDPGCDSATDLSERGTTIWTTITTALPTMRTSVARRRWTRVSTARPA